MGIGYEAHALIIYSPENKKPYHIGTDFICLLWIILINGSRFLKNMTQRRLESDIYKKLTILYIYVYFNTNEKYFYIPNANNGSAYADRYTCGMVEPFFLVSE